MEDLNAGTIETVSIDVEDRLDQVTDISTDPVDYKVEKDDGTDQIAWTPVTNVTLMRVDCLLDTTNWDKQQYSLFIRPTVGSERPILGPYFFDLI